LLSRAIQTKDEIQGSLLHELTESKIRNVAVIRLRSLIPR
jgi:hypothetical protein